MQQMESPKLSGHPPHKLARLAVLSAVVAGVGPTASAAVIFDRNAAVAYANAYANIVVSDGYFWINSGTCVQKGAGVAVPTGSGLAGGVGDDCAHFVSCSIGSEPHAHGGGLPVPSPLYPTYLQYGNPSAPGIISWLLNGYGAKVSSASNLSPGDVIGYDWDGDGTIDHCVLYVGSSKIDAHAASHLGVSWNWYGASNYPNIKTTFVHITAPGIPPKTPSNVAPAGSPQVTSLTPTLSGDAFVDTVLESSQVAAQWRIYRGSSLIFDTGTDTSHLTSYTVPAGKLSSGTDYTWQVRYEDNYGDWSSYSPATAFSTAPVPEPASAACLLGTMLLYTGRRRRPKQAGARG
jgi:hypothetical protein